MKRRALLATLGGSATALAGCVGGADEPPAEETAFGVETVADGLDHPWSVAFLPGGSRFLVTERDAGALALVDRETGDVERLSGVPDVEPAGQGGLLDLALHPDFESEPWVYLTYSATDGNGATATHLGRGRLRPDEGCLEGFEVLRVARPFVESTAHYGSRAVFGPDGALYVTAGDRQFKDFGPDHVSQDPTNELGTTLRLEPDGSIPDDNPFVGEPGAVDSIYSFGHRNPQGMAVHPATGEIWQSEHGERDGDEINVLEAGGNFGWPVATHACEYGTDDPLGDDPDERDDLVAPVHYWECGTGGFPPAGASFYDGDAFPEWQGDLFVGNLAGQYLGRFSVEGREVTEEASLLADREWRVRDAVVAPDTGFLYVAVDAAEAPIVRLVPE